MSLRKRAEEALEARPRGAAEAIDRLVVVADHERVTPRRQQLDQSLLREVEVLVLVDEHVRMTSGVALEDRRVLLEHPHRQQQEVVEVEPTLFAAGTLVRPKQADARSHQLRAICLVR